MIKQRLQSRKFLTTVALELIATICLFTEMATFAEWSQFTMFIMGIYTGANVVGHVTKSETSEPAEVDYEELNGELADYDPL